MKVSSIITVSEIWAWKIEYYTSQSKSFVCAWSSMLLTSRTCFKPVWIYIDMYGCTKMIEAIGWVTWPNDQTCV